MLRRRLARVRPVRSIACRARRARTCRNAGFNGRRRSGTSEPDLQRSDERAAPAGHARRQFEFLIEDVVAGEFELEALVERLPDQEGVCRPVVVELRAGEVALPFADIGGGERDLEVRLVDPGQADAARSVSGTKGKRPVEARRLVLRVEIGDRAERAEAVLQPDIGRRADAVEACRRSTGMVSISRRDRDRKVRQVLVLIVDGGEEMAAPLGVPARDEGVGIAVERQRHLVGLQAEHADGRQRRRAELRRLRA